MPANSAAWFVAKRKALEVGPAPYAAPGRDEIVIRNRAVAINPVDWAIQLTGDLLFSWVRCPAILGSDLAGEVAEVGAGVTRFKVGDRVVGHAVGLNKNRNRNSERAFQLYSVVPAHMASPIPEELSFESASVMPLGLSTAACGLFQTDFLALQHPSRDAKPTGKSLLITGGATSVGSNAIQLAVAAGYEVVTTASPRNFDHVKSLGASHAFDYHGRTLAADIVAALRGKSIAGAFAIAPGSVGLCLDVVHASQGVKFIAIAASPIKLGELAEGGGGDFQILRLLPKMMGSTLANGLSARLRGIPTKFIFGGSLADNEVGAAIYEAFLPQALADGRFVASPPAQVVGAGLDAIQTAFEVQRKGVSARKVVVSL